MRVPQLCRHKHKDLAFIRHEGRQIYLGRWNSPESRKKYDEFLTRLKIEQAASADGSSPGCLGQLMLLFLRYCRETYSSSHVENVRQMLLYLQPMAPLPLSQFGLSEAKQYRAYLAERKLAKATADKHIGLFRTMFRWGREECIVSASVLADVVAVRGFRAGGKETIRREPVAPVADATIEETLPHLPPILADMVRVQRLTGMRPSEVCGMTVREIDTTGPVWVYRPRHHKMAWKGGAREIAIGPRAQAILSPYLRVDLQAHLFTGPRGKKPYTQSLYRQYVQRACDRAWPVPLCLNAESVARWVSEHRWSPNQLRHTHATEVRQAMGLEAAQVALGHRKADTTQIYAARDMKLRAEVARKLG